MKVVHDFPPMIDDIDKAFRVRGQTGILFCWGDTVYMPNGGTLTVQLRAHETVHCGRQAAEGPAAWWRKYIADVEFRVAEEVPAHRAEYLSWVRTEPSRERRAHALRHIVDRLCGPLYGNVLSRQAATRAVLGR